MISLGRQRSNRRYFWNLEVLNDDQIIDYFHLPGGLCVMLCKFTVDEDGTGCMCTSYEVYCQQPKNDRPYQRNAAAFCATRSVQHYGPTGRLAVLRTSSIDQRVREFIMESNLDERGCITRFGFWIGLSDQAEEGEYTWSDGEGFCGTDYRNWAAGEPNNNDRRSKTTGQDCVQLWFRFGHNGLWDDEYCDFRQKGFICQIPDPKCHSKV
ncbi:echinoidin-like [Ptychodera flava]|uniref:echinoidin-like n=1 Tax=Ptychodera flava TaxID=63121 RepID=UPI003969DD23